MTAAKTLPTPTPKVGETVKRNASGQFVVARNLADPAFATHVAALIDRNTATKADSVKFLKRVGVLNHSGKLSKNYRD